MKKELKRAFKRLEDAELVEDGEYVEHYAREINSRIRVDVLDVEELGRLLLESDEKDFDEDVYSEWCSDTEYEVVHPSYEIFAGTVSRSEYANDDHVSVPMVDVSIVVTSKLGRHEGFATFSCVNGGWETAGDSPDCWLSNNILSLKGIKPSEVEAACVEVLPNSYCTNYST